METSLFVAVVLVVAGVLALEFGLSSAITEIVAGVLLALAVDVSGMSWLGFLAHFGLLGVMFMAGFEVDPAVLRRRWRASLTIGLASLLAPLAGVYAVSRFVFGVDHRVAAPLGLALSTTSLALVYHFLRERGLVMSEIVEEHEALEEKLKGIVFSFFAPVFFLAAGARIDLKGIDGWTVLLTLALLAIAVGLKYLGTAGATRFFFPGSERLFGVLFNYRLTFGIITATVGLEEGLLDRRLFTAVTLVILTSAALPMVLLRDLPGEGAAVRA